MSSEAPRPGRRSSRRQVSWLAGLVPLPAFPGCPSGFAWLGLAADSCGGSCGFGVLPRTAFPVRSRNERPSMQRNRRASGGFVNARQCASGDLPVAKSHDHQQAPEDSKRREIAAGCGSFEGAASRGFYPPGVIASAGPGSRGGRASLRLLINASAPPKSYTATYVLIWSTRVCDTCLRPPEIRSSTYRR